MLTIGSYVLVSVHIRNNVVHTPHTKWGEDNRCHINLWLNYQRKYYIWICCLNTMARTVLYTESSPFITRLVIKEIITEIGDNAFEDFEVLTELKLCDGLRQIGNFSFKGCQFARLRLKAASVQPN
jgi:hypothetical protein